MHSNFFISSITCLTILAAFALTTAAQDSDAARPNIVIIMTDDQGYQDLGCFGSPDIKTPNIDRIAAEGLKLTNFYSAQAVCSASRAGLLTGCYPNRIGMHQAFMPHSQKGIATTEVTIAEMLGALGYVSAIFGKWHLGDHPDFSPLNNGFDQFFGILYSNDMWPNHPLQDSVFDFGPLMLYRDREIIDTLTDQSDLTVEITRHSVDFIKKNADQPFFLYVPHPQPHVPLYVSERFEGKSERGLYGDVIMEIDWSVGRIIETLKEEGVYDNTLLIFTSDNGPWLAYGEHSGSALPLREGKGTTWEGGQGVPCVMHLPDSYEQGRVITTPAMSIDILPTLAELTGASLPDHWIDGKSIMPLLTGETDQPVQEAYFFYYRVNELHAVLADHWKLYFPHTYRTLNGKPGGVDGLPAAYEYVTLSEVELYDLATDREETTNVAGRYPEVVRLLSAHAAKARREMGDALSDIKGTATRPPGKAIWPQHN